MWSKCCTDKGTLTNGARSDGKTLKPGSAVFKYNTADGYYHVGLYIGGGYVIEAQGTSAGVVKSKVSKWHCWGELKGVDYSGEAAAVVDSKDYSFGERTLSYKQPCLQGADVKELQTRLNQAGFDCGSADGIFGTATKAALTAYQAAHNLEADGIAGKKTFAEMNNTSSGVTQPEAPETSTEETLPAGDAVEQTYTVQAGDTLWKIAQKIYGKGSLYTKIAQKNNIQGNLIRLGQVLKLP